MATQLNTIIARAYRERQVLDIDETPSTSQSTEALALLQSIIKVHMLQQPQSIINVGTLVTPKNSRTRRLRNFTTLAETLPLPQNVYVNCNLAAPTTLLMPYDAGDGARLRIIDVAGNFATQNLTLDGNGTLIDGSTTAVLADNGSSTDLFYRREIATWTVVSGLIETSNMPFPDEYDDMFTLLLAARLLSRYGKELDGVSAALLNETRDRFKARYNRTASDVEADKLFETEFTALDTQGALSGGRQFI